MAEQFPTDPNQPQVSSPRAFSQATGLIYQTVGFILAMGTCCWWSFTGLAQDEVRAPKGSTEIVQLWRDMKPEQKWALAAICVCLVGGLGLAAVGIGLQHDRIARGVWVVAMTGAVTLFFASYTLMAWWQFPGKGRIIVGGAMTFVWAIMFLMGGTSAEQLRRFPPVTTPETLTSRDVDDLRRAVSPQRRDRTNP
jgi:hypothetical protein